jgi:putative Holliday junction resolvase
MNLAKSIELPVYLQDERLTSVEAAANLRAEGVKPDDIPSRIDGEAAAIILRAFLDTRQERILVSPSNTRDQENE